MHKHKNLPKVVATTTHSATVVETNTKYAEKVTFVEASAKEPEAHTSLLPSLEIGLPPVVEVSLENALISIEREIEWEQRVIALENRVKELEERERKRHRYEK